MSAMRLTGAGLVALTAVVVFAPVQAQQEPGPVNRPRGGAPYAPCTTIGQNTQVRDTLAEFYLWYQFLPDVQPSRYPSPQALLEGVRHRPLDSSFSAITPKAAHDALFDASQYIGFGFTTSIESASIALLQVFPDSPAAEAGLGRGDRIVAIDGRTVASIVAAGDVDGVFGPSEAGVTRTVDVAARDGRSRRATLRKRTVTIPPVTLTRVFSVNGRIVGYILFRQFVRPSTAELDAAFAALRAAGATELVLDLRYNGGGLVDVAVHLASLIGDAATRGQVFARMLHNDKNTRYDETLRFESAASPLRLTRLVAITTRASASASELVINGLRPFLPVVIVGERTYGKPVGQYSFEICDKVLLPVSFQTVNANGQGGYFNGLAADCPAADDISQDLGAAAEASLAVALRFIQTGSCSTAAPPPPGLAPRMGLASPRDDWQVLVNAQ